MLPCLMCHNSYQDSHPFSDDVTIEVKWSSRGPGVKADEVMG